MNPSNKLVFLGDSLTEWYDWQKRFPAFTVMNLGIAGEPVEGLLQRLDRARQAMGDPGMIFLMTGINNIAMESYDILGTYRVIVQKLAGWFPKATLVVQSILPVMLEWMDNSVIRDINRHLQSMAGDLGAEYLDVFSLFMNNAVNPGPGLLLDDGVHLAEEGYRVWADAVDAFLGRRQGS